MDCVILEHFNGLCKLSGDCWCWWPACCSINAGCALVPGWVEYKLVCEVLSNVWETVWAVWRGCVLWIQRAHACSCFRCQTAEYLSLASCFSCLCCCCFGSLCILFKKEAFGGMDCHRLCIVTDCALSQSMHYAFVPCCHKALVWAVKNPKEFSTVKTFCNSPVEYFAVAILSVLVLGFLPASCHSLQLPAPLPLFFNTRIQTYTHPPHSQFLVIASHVVFFVPLLFAVEVPPSPEFCCWCFLPSAVTLHLKDYHNSLKFNSLLLGRKEIKMAAKDCSDPLHLGHWSDEIWMTSLALWAKEPLSLS